MAFLDEWWFLPTFPMPMLLKAEKRLRLHFDDYNHLWETLEGEGFTFLDFLASGPGSATYLEAHGAWESVWASGNQWTAWVAAPPATPFPRAFPLGVQMSEDYFQLLFPSAPLVPWTDFAWEATLMYLPIAEDQKKFRVGWMQRSLTRYFQLRVALGIRNVFGLDTRGRPANL